MIRVVAIAAGLLLATGAQAQVWSGSQQSTYVSFSLSDGKSAVFSVRCEPSASGGRTLPSFFLRVPADRVSFRGLGPETKAEMRLDIGGDVKASFTLSTTSFAIEGGADSASVVFQGYGGSDVHEPTARAILSLLGQASSLTVLARLDQGPWVFQSVPMQGARGALQKTWCGDGTK